MALRKSPADLKKIRTAGAILGQALKLGRSLSVPGANLLDIDRKIHQFILDNDATPSFLGFEGFPNATCLSLNDGLVHGIPTDTTLKEGDLIGIDVGLWKDNVCVDAAITVPVATVSAEAVRLLEVTEKALKAGIAAIKPFRRVGAISEAIQHVGDAAELGIVRVLTGHGVGHQVHEAPDVPNFGRASDGILLQPGMVLAIEPMFTLGSGTVVTDIDGWTIRTKDGSLSAQFEHTVIVTSRGAEIVTS